MIILSYPKSGRTWLIHMLADYFGACLPHRIYNDRGKHWLEDCRIPCRNWVYGYHAIDPDTLQRMKDFYAKPAVYLVRDPRDCITSLYYYRKYVQSPWHKRVRFRLETLVSQGGFVRTSLNEWKQHLRTYRDLCDRCVSYEQLTTDCRGTLAQLVGAGPADMDRIDQAVARNTFQAHSGRTPGQENPRRFARKGIVGDWRNHYAHPQWENLFKDLVGEELVALGYEKDRNWRINT